MFGWLSESVEFGSLAASTLRLSSEPIRLSARQPTKGLSVLEEFDHLFNHRERPHMNACKREGLKFLFDALLKFVI